MSTFFDGESVTGLNCPNCGQKLETTVGRLKGGNYACPACGATFDTKEFGRVIEQAESDVAEAMRKIKKSLGG